MDVINIYDISIITLFSGTDLPGLCLCSLFINQILVYVGEAHRKAGVHRVVKQMIGELLFYSTIIPDDTEIELQYILFFVFTHQENRGWKRRLSVNHSTQSARGSQMQSSRSTKITKPSMGLDQRGQYLKSVSNY